MNVQCSCGAAYQVDSNLAGKQVRCKQCKNVFVVPVKTTQSVPPATHPIPQRQKSPAELKREKEDAILAKYTNSGKKSAEDFRADNIRDEFEEQQHSAAIQSVFVGPVCMGLSLLAYYLLCSLENGGIAPRIVWVFVLLRGKYWLPPIMFLYGAWSLFAGITDLIRIEQTRRGRTRK